MSNFTSALEIIGTPYHVTLCFCPAKKAGKFKTTNLIRSAKVLRTEYWERVDLTVMIIESDFINSRHNYYNSLGYTYSHEFIPHATVGKGDLVDAFKKWEGKQVDVGNEYARVY